MHTRTHIPTLSHHPKTRHLDTIPDQTRPHYSLSVFVFVWNLAQSLWLVMGWLTHKDEIHANPNNLFTLMLLFKHRRPIRFPPAISTAHQSTTSPLHVNKLKDYSKMLLSPWHVRVSGGSKMKWLRVCKVVCKDGLHFKGWKGHVFFNIPLICDLRVGYPH